MSEQAIPEEFKKRIQQHHVAINKLINGDSTSWKQDTSKRDDVSITGAWGGYDRGWENVSRRLDWAMSRFRGTNNHCRFENISLVYTPELAYSIDIEYNTVGLIDRDDQAMMALRVTTIFRREDGEWKMVHRHGDPTVSELGVASVIRK